MMEEKDLKKMIEEQSEKIQIPAALEPERVTGQLEERAKKRKRAYHRRIMAAAACCVVVVGAGAVGAGLFDISEKYSKEEASTEADVESAKGSVDSGSTGAEMTIASAKDYDEIYSYIEAENKRRRQSSRVGTMEEKTESVMDLGASPAADTASNTESGAGYSDTNIREEGVGEGDIVKTDGEKLYVLNNHRISIVDITGEELEELGTVELGSDIYVSEIFVKNDRLIAVYTWSEYLESDDSSTYGSYREYSAAETFDVSDPKEPKPIGKVTQSGSFHTMRVVGNYAYMLSDYYPDMGCAARDIEGYVPMIQGKTMESTDVFLPLLKAGSRYTVITSFSLDDPAECIDSKAVFGTMGMCYVSKENIYICESDYGYGAGSSDVTRTWIRKISYKDGKLKAVGQTKVDGILNDSFSIDEYNGNLRLVTTVSAVGNDGIMPLPLFGSRDETDSEEPEKDSNTLYILDEGLKELSRIQNLAEDEQVYSARFMGDAGYFVTYRQIDPLFSVDLSDPKNPKILGELKIPGFSEYLHPFGEGLLLGIGMDVDETGTTTNGVKLSMFDISDPGNVKEIQKYVIEGSYSTDVAYNYKAAFIDVEKGLVGFSAYGEYQKYDIFSYDEEKGFEIVFERELTGMSSNVRGFYADDTFYLAAGNTVESYRLGTFEKIDDIVL